MKGIVVEISISVHDKKDEKLDLNDEEKYSIKEVEWDKVFFFFFWWPE